MSFVPSTEHLTEAERLDRIGELLYTAALRYCRRQAHTGVVPEVKPPPLSASIPAIAASRDTYDIVAYLAKAGPAPPRDIREALGLSRTTAFRRLRDLVEAGQVKLQGRTHALTYGLVEPSDPSRN